MGKILLCPGKYAENPYYMERAFVNIYSVEELCYCLMQNVFLIDREVVDRKLAEWIGRECGLTELADSLIRLMKRDCSVGEFAEAILEYIGYGSWEEISRTKANLVNDISMNIYEKKKNRADFFLENKKYILALKYYNILLEELPDAERELNARVYHNRGVAYAGIFRFKEAAESFRQVFEYEKSEDSYMQYLSAVRMHMDDAEYLNFAAGQTGNYELSLKVEELLKNIKEQFEGTEESRMLFTLKVCKEEKNTVSYYEEIDKITGELREQYRNIVAE